MKITIEIPEWAEKRHIRVFAGMELIAYQGANTKEMMVKYSPCAKCGLCCEHIKNHPFPTDNGRCVYLVSNPGTNEKLCSLGLSRPFACCIYIEKDKSCKGMYKRYED